MARRFVQRQFVTRPHKRAVFWGRAPADVGFTALNAATALLDSTSVPAIEGETIVRIRGSLWVVSDQIAATEEAVGALGAGVFNSSAVAVGVGSLPTPSTDQDSQMWMLWLPWQARFAFGSDTTGFELNGAIRYDFDSKAMRKMETGQTLAFIIENISGGSGALYYLQYSVLFKVM